MSDSSVVQVQPAIELCCRALRSIGVSSVTPEVMRGAKFDADDSIWPLWMALHDLIVIDKQYLPTAPACGPMYDPTAEAAAHVYTNSLFDSACRRADCWFDAASPTQLTPLASNNCEPMQKMWVLLSNSAGDELPNLVHTFVCHHLAWCGYGKAEAWLHASTSVTAKSLLVAFAWQIGRCRLFQRYAAAVAQCVENLASTMSASCSAIPEPWIKSATAAAERIHRRIFRCTVDLDVPELTQQTLAEHNRLLHAARELSTLQIECANLQDQLQVWYRHQRQLKADAPTPGGFGLCELRLASGHVQHAYCEEEYKVANRLLEELDTVETHEKNFWVWMQSVLPVAAGSGEGQVLPVGAWLDGEAAAQAVTVAADMLTQTLHMNGERIAAIDGAVSVRQAGKEDRGTGVGAVAAFAEKHAEAMSVSVCKELYDAVVAVQEYGKEADTPGRANRSFLRYVVEPTGPLVRSDTAEQRRVVPVSSQSKRRAEAPILARSTRVPVADTELQKAAAAAAALARRRLRVQEQNNASILEQLLVEHAKHAKNGQHVRPWKQ